MQAHRRADARGARVDRELRAVLGGAARLAGALPGRVEGTARQMSAPDRSETESAPATAVHVTRELPASRADVFRAWTEPDLFARWFTPPGNSPVSAGLDVRPGGSSGTPRGGPQLARGTSHIVGRYLEVEPPERLVFTFGWDEPPPVPGLGDL